MFAHGEHARKGCQMRFKATFLAGFAAGFVAGARAGRERYEQMKKAGRKVAENPTVQKATRAAGGKTSASKVRGQLDRIPGRHSTETGADTGTDSDPSAVNGTRPAD